MGSSFLLVFSDLESLMCMRVHPHCPGDSEEASSRTSFRSAAAVLAVKCSPFVGPKPSKQVVAPAAKFCVFYLSCFVEACLQSGRTHKRAWALPSMRLSSQPNRMIVVSSTANQRPKPPNVDHAKHRSPFQKSVGRLVSSHTKIAALQP